MDTVSPTIITASIHLEVIRSSGHSELLGVTALMGGSPLQPPGQDRVLLLSSGVHHHLADTKAALWVRLESGLISRTPVVLPDGIKPGRPVVVYQETGATMFVDESLADELASMLAGKMKRFWFNLVD